MRITCELRNVGTHTETKGGFGVHVEEEIVDGGEVKLEEPGLFACEFGFEHHAYHPSEEALFHQEPRFWVHVLVTHLEIVWGVIRRAEPCHGASIDVGSHDVS